MLDGLIVDEAHRIRNRKSQQSAAVIRLGKSAKKRLALTGTPSVRDGHDVFPILQFLYPMKFTSYWAFVERYFEMKKDFFSGGYKPGDYKRKAELQGMLAMMGTNRKRKEVMQWLPDKEYMTVPVELTPKQRKAYDLVLKEFEFIDEDGDMKVDAPSVLAQMTRLRQICLAPRMLDIDAPSAKEEFLIEWLQDNKEPVIVFSQFTSYLVQLEKKLKDSPLYEKVVCVHGRLNSEEREESVRRFQSGEVRILLANIEAAGVGLTISRAEVTIFLDKHFNTVYNEQAEDRMVPVRKEELHKMTVLSLVAADTVDEKIELLLKYKKSIVEVVNSGGLQAVDRLYQELKLNEGKTL